jgi:hypothetical protein
MDITSDFLYFIFIGKDELKINFIKSLIINDNNFFLIFWFYKKILINPYSQNTLIAISNSIK